MSASRWLTFAVLLLGLTSCAAPAPVVNPLPSWNESPARQAILDFVDQTTREGSPYFRERAERIAVFDNDGTLWCEKPYYVQLQFALDRVKALAEEHPEWRETQPFQAVLEDDLETVMKGGEKALLELVMASHADLTSLEFSAVVREWLATARHPKTGRPYQTMLYQPMLELLSYLRAHGYRNYIVSGGGVEFMRPWAEAAYGIPPEQVIGSSIKIRYEIRDGEPVLMRLPEMNFLDDKAGKPVAIHQHLGRRPIAAFGNSDGDLQMLQWTAAGPGLSLALLVHHTDAAREWAYDRDSAVGRLDEALSLAREEGWAVVDMARDWNCVFAFDKP